MSNSNVTTRARKLAGDMHDIVSRMTTPELTRMLAQLDPNNRIHAIVRLAVIEEQARRHAMLHGFYAVPKTPAKRSILEHASSWVAGFLRRPRLALGWGRS